MSEGSQKSGDIDVASLYRSRRGRVVIPALAHWKGEKPVFDGGELVGIARDAGDFLDKTSELVVSNPSVAGGARRPQLSSPRRRRSRCASAGASSPARASQPVAQPRTSPPSRQPIKRYKLVSGPAKRSRRKLDSGAAADYHRSHLPGRYHRVPSEVAARAEQCGQGPAQSHKVGSSGKKPARHNAATSSHPEEGTLPHVANPDAVQYRSGELSQFNAVSAPLKNIASGQRDRGYSSRSVPNDRTAGAYRRGAANLGGSGRVELTPPYRAMDRTSEFDYPESTKTPSLPSTPSDFVSTQNKDTPPALLEGHFSQPILVGSKFRTSPTPLHNPLPSSQPPTARQQTARRGYRSTRPAVVRSTPSKPLARSSPRLKARPASLTPAFSLDEPLPADSPGFAYKQTAALHAAAGFGRYSQGSPESSLRSRQQYDDVAPQPWRPPGSHEQRGPPLRSKGALHTHETNPGGKSAARGKGNKQTAGYGAARGSQGGRQVGVGARGPRARGGYKVLGKRKRKSLLARAAASGVKDQAGGTVARTGSKPAGGGSSAATDSPEHGPQQLVGGRLGVPDGHAGLEVKQRAGDSDIELSLRLGNYVTSDEDCDVDGVVAGTRGVGNVRSTVGAGVVSSAGQQEKANTSHTPSDTHPETEKGKYLVQCTRGEHDTSPAAVLRADACKSAEGLSRAQSVYNCVPGWALPDNDFSFSPVNLTTSLPQATPRVAPSRPASVEGDALGPVIHPDAQQVGYQSRYAAPVDEGSPPLYPHNAMHDSGGARIDPAAAQPPPGSPPPYKDPPQRQSEAASNHLPKGPALGRPDDNPASEPLREEGTPSASGASEPPSVSELLFGHEVAYGPQDERAGASLSTVQMPRPADGGHHAEGAPREQRDKVPLQGPRTVGVDHADHYLRHGQRQGDPSLATYGGGLDLAVLQTQSESTLAATQPSSPSGRSPGYWDQGRQSDVPGSKHQPPHGDSVWGAVDGVLPPMPRSPHSDEIQLNYSSGASPSYARAAPRAPSTCVGSRQDSRYGPPPVPKSEGAGTLQTAASRVLHHSGGARQYVARQGEPTPVSEGRHTAAGASRYLGEGSPAQASDEAAGHARQVSCESNRERAESEATRNASGDPVQKVWAHGKPAVEGERISLEKYRAYVAAGTVINGGGGGGGPQAVPDGDANATSKGAPTDPPPHHTVSPAHSAQLASGTLGAANPVEPSHPASMHVVGGNVVHGGTQVWDSSGAGAPGQSVSLWPAYEERLAGSSCTSPARAPLQAASGHGGRMPPAPERAEVPHHAAEMRTNPRGDGQGHRGDESIFKFPLGQYAEPATPYLPPGLGHSQDKGLVPAEGQAGLPVGDGEEGYRAVTPGAHSPASIQIVYSQPGSGYEEQRLGGYTPSIQIVPSYPGEHGDDVIPSQPSVQLVEDPLAPPGGSHQPCAGHSSGAKEKYASRQVCNGADASPMEGLEVGGGASEQPQSLTPYQQVVPALHSSFTPTAVLAGAAARASEPPLPTWQPRGQPGTGATDTRATVQLVRDVILVTFANGDTCEVDMRPMLYLNQSSNHLRYLPIFNAALQLRGTYAWTQSRPPRGRQGPAANVGALESVQHVSTDTVNAEPNSTSDLAAAAAPPRQATEDTPRFGSVATALYFDDHRGGDSTSPAHVRKHAKIVASHHAAGEAARKGGPPTNTQPKKPRGTRTQAQRGSPYPAAGRQPGSAAEAARGAGQEGGPGGWSGEKAAYPQKGNDSRLSPTPDAHPPGAPDPTRDRTRNSTPPNVMHPLANAGGSAPTSQPEALPQNPPHATNPRRCSPQPPKGGLQQVAQQQQGKPPAASSGVGLRYYLDRQDAIFTAARYQPPTYAPNTVLSGKATNIYGPALDYNTVWPSRSPRSIPAAGAEHYATPPAQNPAHSHCARADHPTSSVPRTDLSAARLQQPHVPDYATHHTNLPGPGCVGGPTAPERGPPRGQPYGPGSRTFWEASPAANQHPGTFSAATPTERASSRQPATGTPKDYRSAGYLPGGTTPPPFDAPGPSNSGHALHAASSVVEPHELVDLYPIEELRALGSYRFGHGGNTFAAGEDVQSNLDSSYGATGRRRAGSEVAGRSASQRSSWREKGLQEYMYRVSHSSMRRRLARVAHADGWSDNYMYALSAAYLRVDPDAPDFWRQVASRVPGRGARECRAAFGMAPVSTPARGSLPKAVQRELDKILRERGEEEAAEKLWSRRKRRGPEGKGKSRTPQGSQIHAGDLAEPSKELEPLHVAVTGPRGGTGRASQQLAAQQWAQEQRLESRARQLAERLANNEAWTDEDQALMEDLRVEEATNRHSSVVLRKLPRNFVAPRSAQQPPGVRKAASRTKPGKSYYAKDILRMLHNYALYQEREQVEDPDASDRDDYFASDLSES